MHSTLRITLICMEPPPRSPPPASLLPNFLSSPHRVTCCQRLLTRPQQQQQPQPHLTLFTCFRQKLPCQVCHLSRAKSNRDLLENQRDGGYSELSISPFGREYPLGGCLSTLNLTVTCLKLRSFLIDVVWRVERSS